MAWLLDPRPVQSTTLDPFRTALLCAALWAMLRDVIADGRIVLPFGILWAPCYWRSLGSAADTTALAWVKEFLLGSSSVRDAST